MCSRDFGVGEALVGATVSGGGVAVKKHLWICSNCGDSESVNAYWKVDGVSQMVCVSPTCSEVISKGSKVHAKVESYVWR